MLKEIIIAVQAYWKAHLFIKTHKLWKWILIPGILYCILFMISMYYFAHTSNNFIEWLTLKTGLKNWLDKLDSGWMGFFFTISSFALWLVMMLFYFSLFKYVFLLVGSPIFAYLSQKIEAIIEEKPFQFNSSQLLKDIKRSSSIVTRNIIRQSIYVIALLFASIIPVIGLIVPIIALFVESYYYGFSMLDYCMNRHSKPKGESVFFITNHQGYAIGNGMLFYSMHWIPILGWVLAPAYAIVAATFSIYPLKELQ